MLDDRNKNQRTIRLWSMKVKRENRLRTEDRPRLRVAKGESKRMKWRKKLENCFDLLKIRPDHNNSLYFEVLLWDYVRYIDIYIYFFTVVFDIDSYLFYDFLFPSIKNTSINFVCIDQHPLHDPNAINPLPPRFLFFTIEIFFLSSASNNGGANWELSYYKKNTFESIGNNAFFL